MRRMSTFLDGALPVFMVLSTYWLGNAKFYPADEPASIALRFTVTVLCIGCTTFLAALGLRKLSEP